MAVAAGTKFGSYEVVGILGAGGMGEVYRARDTTLKRDVAIKVLPAALVLDANRLARFQREAQVLASLNHPNIAAIYGVEQLQGNQALVLELVEGLTLAEKVEGLKARGAGLPIDEALAIARQIADALEAAHGQGIVHRDLKPANIKLRPDGMVKVLDFGLARGVDADSSIGGPSSLSISPTLTASPMTGIGMILGTAAYMSPEQARGRTVDKRADIWAFGCVLYELLTGRPVFDGSDVSDVMASVIKSDVRWDALPAQTPASIRRLLQRCLQKDPNLRLRDIGDARLEIDEALAHPESPAQVPPARRRRARRVLMIQAAAAAVTLLASAAAWWLRAEAPARPLWFTVLPQQAPALSMYPTVAPDGRQIAFVALNDAGRPQLWLRTLDNPSVRPLPGTEGATEPFWSPDSQSLAFFAESKMKRLDLDATSPQILADVPQVRGRGNWGPDGTIYYSTPFSGIRKRTVDGTISELTTLGPGDTEHSSPFVLPDGRSFLYTSRNAGEGKTGIYTRALEGGEPTLILPVYSRAEFVNGYLIFGREIGLYKQAYDFKRQKLSGEPIRLAEKVGVSGGNMSLYAFASSPTAIVYWEDSFLPLSQLTVFDRSGRALQTIGQPGEHIALALSPDERYFALERRDPKTNIMDVWLQEVSAAQASRFTSTTIPWRWTGAPRWMPSGDRLLFTEFSDDYLIKTIPGRGPTATDRISHHVTTGGGWPSGISSDGKWIVTSVNEPKTGYDIWRVSADGTGKSEKYLGDRFHERQPRLAPGDAAMAYVLDETGRNEVYVDSFPTPGNRRMVSAGGGTLPIWRKDGRELYYIASNGDLTVVDISTAGTTIQSSPPRALFRSPRVPQIDGQRDVYAVLGQGERFVFIGILPNQQSPGVTVAMNWKEK